MFLAEQLASLLPAIFLWLIFSPRRPYFDRRNFDHLFVLALAGGPLLITLLLGFATGVHLVPRWGFPFFNLFGVALLVLFPSEVDGRKVSRFVGGVSALTLTLVFGLFWVIYVRPFMTGRPPYSITFPTRPLAELVTNAWHQRNNTPLPIVAGDRYLASGVIAYSPDRPVPFFDWEPGSNPWMSESQLYSSGAVFVHKLAENEVGTAFTQRMRSHYPTLTDQDVVTLPQLSAAPLSPARIWVAYLPPAAVADAVHDSLSSVSTMK